jgi:hypothetical protein
VSFVISKPHAEYSQLAAFGRLARTGTDQPVRGRAHGDFLVRMPAHRKHSGCSAVTGNRTRKRRSRAGVCLPWARASR